MTPRMRTSRIRRPGHVAQVQRPLTVRLHPDPVLRHTCEPVERFDCMLADLCEEMLELMRRLEGIGLAAPQVGIGNRILVAELEDRPMCMINPCVYSKEGLDRMFEGCLSLPGVRMDIERAGWMEVAFLDVFGKERRDLFTGMWARVIQHEIDHLNGVLICDYGSPSRDIAGGVSAK